VASCDRAINRLTHPICRIAEKQSPSKKSEKKTVGYNPSCIQVASRTAQWCFRRLSGPRETETTARRQCLSSHRSEAHRNASHARSFSPRPADQKPQPPLVLLHEQRQAVRPSLRSQRRSGRHPESDALSPENETIHAGSAENRYSQTSHRPESTQDGPTRRLPVCEEAGGTGEGGGVDGENVSRRLR